MQRPPSALPFPPFPLMHRVGSLQGHPEPEVEYERMGRAQAQMLHDLLPSDFGFAGKRVLDFGCGAGKTLRHLVEEAESAEIWGCDVHAPSIEWAEAQLAPPFRFVLSSETPPLPFEAESFDLVYAFSVFTHLVETSSAWLLELHRVLRPDGLAIVTFLGRTYAPEYAGEPWDETRVGRNFLRCGQSWDLGGPSVLMSTWWIRAHWGRAFDFVDLRDIDGGQGVAVMRKRQAQLSPADIDRPEPGEPRELSAALAHAEQLARELVRVRTEPSHQPPPEWTEFHRLSAELASARLEAQRAQAEAHRLQAALDTVCRSRSWRITAPLRRVAGLLRTSGGRVS